MRGYTERVMFNTVAVYSVYHECCYGIYNLICAFWVTIYKTIRLMLSDCCLSCLSCLSVLSCPVCLPDCNVGVLWPIGWTDQDETWHVGRPRPWPHCLRWGPSSPLSNGHSPPIFGPYLLWPTGQMDQDAIWYGCRP